MVSKKSPQANLENKKAIPMMMGLVMVLSLLFIAFEWSQNEFNKHDNYATTFIPDDEELPPDTEEAPPIEDEDEDYTDNGEEDNNQQQDNQEWRKFTGINQFQSTANCGWQA